jgi:pimeloyl-ACP methyl ester carboxylesterase
VIELLQDVAAWAWARHHNVLSWYVRPLFLLPLAWAAWRRSGWGIAATLVALVTSMAWFPAPARPDPRVLEFLAFEREYLTGGWTLGKVLLSLVPIALVAAYCLAFWRRSPGWGLVLLNAMALGKLLWGVVLGDGTGWAMTGPLLAGLAVGDVALVLAARRLRGRRAEGSESAAAMARFRAAHPVRRLTVDGREWTYTAGGAGPRTLLYLPGGTGRAEAASPALTQLERTHRVIAVDLPAVGSLDAAVDGALAVLDREGVDAAVVWGSSFGAMLAQRLVRRAPHRVSALVLSGAPAPDPARARRLARLAALPPVLARWTLRMGLARQLRGLPAAERSFWRGYLNAHPPVDLVPLAAEFHRSRFAPGEVRVPVLLLAAEDDRVHPQGPLRALYPGAIVRSFPGGHVPTAERERAMAAAVAEQSSAGVGARP